MVKKSFALILVVCAAALMVAGFIAGGLLLSSYVTGLNLPFAKPLADNIIPSVIIISAALIIGWIVLVLAGRFLISKPANLICPSCGKSNRAGAKACRQCGTPLSPASTSGAADAQSTARLPEAPAVTQPVTPAPDAAVTRRIAAPNVSTVRLAELSALAAGTKVHQRYQIVQLFDSNTHVNRYLVSDQQQGGTPFLMRETDNSQPFLRESELCEKHITHPALYLITDSFAETVDGQPRSYFISEHPCAGVTTEQPWREIDVLQTGAQLADALATLHSHNIAHGAVQVGSLVNVNNQIKLWNFNGVTELTPEKRDKDVYQLAGTLLQLATPAGQSAPAFTPATAQVFHRALARDARERYADARSFAQDLESAADALRHPSNTTTVVGRLSDVGMRRELDEDSLLTTEIVRFTHAGSQVVGLYAVADGMGGASAGEVASKRVTETIAREITTNLLVPQFAGDGGQPDYGALLTHAVEQANEDVFKERQRAHTDMGSTLVAALLVGTHAYIANVGDSRAYLVTPDKIQKITKDHSLVQALVDRGQITEAEIRTHPQRNYILRNVGDKPQVAVDLFQVQIEPGQHLLLCCDGLWEMVLEDQIHKIVNSNADPQQAARQLIDAANKAGGDDNITCIVVRIEKAEGNKRP